MPLPITAFALSSSLGTDAESTFDALCGTAPSDLERRTPDQVLTTLGEPIVAAGQRWGRRRLAAALSAGSEDIATSISTLSRSAGCQGPVVSQLGCLEAGARGIAMASRWIAAGVADAVLVGAVTDSLSASAWLLLERHGDSDIALACPAAATPDLRWGGDRQLSSLKPFGTTTALVYAIVAGHSIRDGRVPSHNEAPARVIDVDSVGCDVGGISFSVEACDA